MIKSNHDHVVPHKCLIHCLQNTKLPHGFLTRNLFFSFSQSIFTFSKILNKACPCCKHMPSKLDDHFVGAFHWQYETIHIINGKKNTIAYIRILYEKYPQYQHLTPLTKGYPKFQGCVCVCVCVKAPYWS